MSTPNSNYSIHYDDGDDNLVDRPPAKGYIVTGSAAHGRVGRLLHNLLEEHQANDSNAAAAAAGLCSNSHQNGCISQYKWMDMSPYAKIYSPPLDGCNGDTVSFVWENAPRSETKPFRDYVQCYSHLPNGILLDDKWALARLLGGTKGGTAGRKFCMDDGGDPMKDPNLATLESHCFRGAEFALFAKRVGLVQDEKNGGIISAGATDCRDASTDADDATNYQWEDLLPRIVHINESSATPPPSPKNLWVIKDAMSNGAGGIWILDESNVHDFLVEDACEEDGNNSPSQTDTLSNGEDDSILHPAHRYIAQRYAWPPTLYQGRKCHVRVYALITCDGKAYVHRRAFLHVANELFSAGGTCGEGDNDSGLEDENGEKNTGRVKFEPSVHITNCCANSHDLHKFAGEICVDLETMPPNRTYDNSNEPLDDVEDGILPLGDYLPSISASVAALAQSFMPFVKGGEANCGFEYLGLDFVLSSVEEAGDDSSLPTATAAMAEEVTASALNPNPTKRCKRKPVAYLLEVNAPPSQDTATGLSHAEELHDEVISDLLRMWVLPNVGIANHGNSGGWNCVYDPISTKDIVKEEDSAKSSVLIVPSKAAILNRIRWTLFERKALKEHEQMWHGSDEQSLATTKAAPSNEASSCGKADEEEQKDECESTTKNEESFDLDAFVSFVRSQFPYFAEQTKQSQKTLPEQQPAEIDPRATTASSNSIFFESAGGAQVPRIVSDAVLASLSNRDRSVVGAKQQKDARQALSSLLIADTNEDSNHVVIMGSNATSLLDQLARKISRSGIITEGCEIVIASENHLANVTPWLEVAKECGAIVKWWTVDDSIANHYCQDQVQQNDGDIKESCILSDLITEQTKVVAVSHVSNILGQERDLTAICNIVRRVTKNRGHVVVDGVAAAPHLLSSQSIAMGRPDWYVVSLHKLFGPHLGCLIGKRSSMVDILCNESSGDTSCSCEAPAIAAAPISDEQLVKSWEMGTMNYEACRGAIELKNYIDTIGAKAYERFGVRPTDDQNDTLVTTGICSSSQTSNQVTSESPNDHLGCNEVNILRSTSHDATLNAGIARMCVQQVEKRLLSHLLGYLQSCSPLVRIIEDVGKMTITSGSEYDIQQQIPNPGRNEIKLQRIPIVSFIHTKIPSYEIVNHCRNHGIMCRACKFLATDRLWNELKVNSDDGVVRFSLAHYNTLDEINESIRVLEMLIGWSPLRLRLNDN